MKTIFENPVFIAIQREVLSGETDAGVASDWLYDAGIDDATVLEETDLPRRVDVYDVWNLGSGRGSGRGSGIGRGSGRGSGSGSGIGRGSGNGIGNGRGVLLMETGKAYLVHCGDWHTFVGRIVEKIGPHLYRMEKASKIAETNNGDCWEELAAGNLELRGQCDYKHYTTPACVPLSIIAFEWVGNLPQEK